MRGAGLLLAMLVVAQPQGPTIDTLLARATTYVRQFVASFSNVVAEERYVQESTIPPRTTGPGVTSLGPAIVARRVLTSEFLLIRRGETDSFQILRDVLEVDGHPVPDRRDRLTALLLEPSQGALDEAFRIARESARFNLVSSRTLNTPLVALAFLQPRYRSRFRFSLGRADSEAGPDVWVVEYTERARPTILRTIDDRDLAASGQIWIERNTGRVVKTALAVSADDRIVTSFRFDERFAIAVPVEMRESYSSGPAHYLGVATYGQFRRFGVSTEEKIELPVAR